jgi:hypothetical protein
LVAALSDLRNYSEKLLGAVFIFVILPGMDHLALAAEILQRAEADLRETVAKAVASGDYDSVVQIASWAKTLRGLLEQTPPKRGADVGFTNGNATVTAQVKKGRAQAKKKRAADDYPRFFRKGDELVRIAWSRRARSEYQHRTTHAVLKTVADSLSQLGKRGRIFSTDEVLPLRDDQGTEIPAYQAYVVIALLKFTGLIEPHGRQGYSISSTDDLNQAVDVLWRKLPAK